MDSLYRGRQCFERRAWDAAYQALLDADRRGPLSGGDLERLAGAAYLSGRDSEFHRLLERRHRQAVEAGECAPAARCAFWLALTSLLRGEIGQSNAWVARGRRLIEGEDCAEQGYLSLVTAEQQLLAGEVGASLSIALRAAQAGERFSEPDLTAAARHTYGRALIEQGEVVAGLESLDEAMLPVVAGELSPMMTGLMYCSVLGACRLVHAFDRAREWTTAFSSLCAEQPEMVAFSGVCRVHRAEILQMQGAWPDALDEASRACEQARRADRKPPGAALYRQAEIHRLRGELARAESAYRAASELGCEPQPGLALLRLAQGRTAAACAAIRRLMSATGDRARRAGLLPAAIEIALAIGEVDEAARARDELRELAQTFDSDSLRAVVAQTDGAIALARGAPRSAIDPLRGAFELWERHGAVRESARVRAMIGNACAALGDDEAAALEREAARCVFARLGAAPDLARLDRAKAGARGRAGPLTARELQVLRLISRGRTNREIADELGVSGRTVDRHVSNILGKLDVPSRAAATAYAYDHRLF